MAINSGSIQAKPLRVNGQPFKRTVERFAWPRTAEDDPKIQLGIDVVVKKIDITKIVGKFFRVEGVSMEELLQEVFVAIIHKNYTRSAHDSRKSSFGHYVFMIGNNCCRNLVHKMKRYNKERDSIDAPHASDDGDTRSLLDTVASTPPENDPSITEYMEEIEQEMRERGMWDQARYLTATRSGASPDIVREALSFGGRTITSKSIREVRDQIKEVMEDLSE